MRSVKSAKLHQSLFVEGVADLGTTLPPKQKKFDLEMSYSDEGLEVLVNGHHILVPPATVAYIEFKKANLKPVA